MSRKLIGDAIVSTTVSETQLTTGVVNKLNSGSNTVTVRANSASEQNTVALNFVNTATVSVSVTAGSAGNANISFTAADAGFNPFLLAGM